MPHCSIAVRLARSRGNLRLRHRRVRRRAAVPTYTVELPMKCLMAYNALYVMHGALSHVIQHYMFVILHVTQFRTTLRDNPVG